MNNLKRAPVGAGPAVAVVLALAAGQACAQSSLSVYARIDVSWNYRDFDGAAGKPSTRLNTVSSDTSWIGFRGVEDLGGGMKAYFKLENGFQADTGAQTSASTLFNRESYVGLSDARLGGLQIGSQFAPSIAIAARSDPFLRSNLGAQYSLFQGSTAGSRGYPSAMNNAIQYVSPAWGRDGAWTARALYAAGEAVQPAPSYAGSVEYATPDVYLAALVTRHKVAAPGAAATAPLADSRTAALAAKVAVPFGSLHGWLQENRMPGQHDTRGAMLGAIVPVGDTVGDMRASLARQDIGTGVGIQSAVGYFYHLSKQTMWYAVAARLKNRGNAAFVMAPANVESAALKLPEAGQSINGLQLGMRAHF